MRRKRIDSKNVIIGVLAALVIVEAFFLFVYKPQKSFVQKRIAKSATVKEIPKKLPIAVPVVPKATAVKSAVPVIAVIIDDCGYNLLPCKFAPSIPASISFSILPDLQHSTKVAECVHANNKEVMLHLPLEPHEILEKYPKEYLIKTTMTQGKIESILRKNLNTIPYLSGVNNHTGSKATEDRRTMSVIFSVLKERGLFFVDSLVTDHSVCNTLAQDMHLPFTARDTFLDNENEREYIEGQFAHLADQAKRRGYALAIGHARSLTLQIVKEQIEKLEKEGFRFVTVRELINQQ